MADTFRAMCAELHTAIQLYTGQNPAAANVPPAELVCRLMDAMAASAALLAQPEPEGLTDEELLELMPQQFRDDLATVSRLAAHGAGSDITPGIFRVSLNTGALSYARIAADRARRPTPQPLPFGYIDPEHQGEDLALLQTFYRACNAEGGTADEIHLRGIRAVLATHPTPQPPADGEVGEQ